MKQFSIILLFVALLFSGGCATHPQVMAPVEDALIHGDYEQAQSLVAGLKDMEKGKDRVLFYFHAGLVSHLNGEYEMSNQYFDKADEQIEQLYTRSVSAEAAAFVSNDLVISYRGEDFETVLIHYYMALNYLLMGELEEALVECRRVNIKLDELNTRYDDNKNVYKADAFVHYLMGIIYEANGDVNNAFVAYRNAVDVYEADYSNFYGLSVPSQLKDDFLRTAEAQGASAVLNEYRDKWDIADWTHPRESYDLGRLVVIWDNGLAPYKGEDAIEVPFEDYYLRVAFPVYIARASKLANVQIQAGQQASKSEKVEDITLIAMKNLDDRKQRVIAKAAARGVAKYALKEKVEDEFGETAGCIVNIFNVATERADTRAWQTLPDEIHIGSMFLEPDRYDVKLDFMDHYNQVDFSDTFEDLQISKRRTTFITYRTF